jgi:hypothetical protein
MVRNNEPGKVAVAVNPDPEFVIFQKAENILVRNRVPRPNHKKLFVVLYQLRNVFAEKRKRRVSHNNIGLLEQFDTFRAAKIAVTTQRAVSANRVGARA